MRLSYLLLGVAAMALVAVQIAIKPGLNAQDVEAAAQVFSRPSEWYGQRAKEFELTLRDGSTFRLADHIGRDVVVLNFFATWSEPSRDELPELQRFADSASAALRPFVLIGVDAREPPDQVERFVTQLGLRFPVGVDATGVLLRKYGVTTYPTTVVIGADGRITLYQVGAIHNADVAFASTVPQEWATLAAGRNTRNDTTDAPANDARRSGFTPPDAAGVGGLTGRARAIAEAMPCPCGCDDLRVAACSCQTAKAIKAKLRAGVDATLSDGKVMEQLNKEFCMKGM